MSANLQHAKNQLEEVKAFVQQGAAKREVNAICAYDFANVFLNIITELEHITRKVDSIEKALTKR